MTTERSGMSLEEVRDWLRDPYNFNAPTFNELADAIDTHLKECAREGSVPEAKVCSWHQCDDDGGSWDTGCGHMFQFTADGPEENNFTHCCFCGGTLDEHPWTGEEAEDEIAARKEGSL